jgi:hypothetical protein
MKKAECLGRRKIEDELELGRLLDREVGRLRPAQNLVDKVGIACLLERGGDPSGRAAHCTHQKRDTKKGPRRQDAGMARPLPNSAHGDKSQICEMPRYRALFTRHSLIDAQRPDWLAGAGGFEPLHFRIGIRQDSQPGRRDSNLCISKSSKWRIWTVSWSPQAVQWPYCIIRDAVGRPSPTRHI